jgi:hypothetical protein
LWLNIQRMLITSFSSRDLEAAERHLEATESVHRRWGVCKTYQAC